MYIVTIARICTLPLGETSIEADSVIWHQVNHVLLEGRRDGELLVRIQ